MTKVSQAELVEIVRRQVFENELYEELALMEIIINDEIPKNRIAAYTSLYRKMTNELMDDYTLSALINTLKNKPSTEEEKQ